MATRRRRRELDGEDWALPPSPAPDRVRATHLCAKCSVPLRCGAARCLGATLCLGLGALLPARATLVSYHMRELRQVHHAPHGTCTFASALHTAAEGAAGCQCDLELRKLYCVTATRDSRADFSQHDCGSHVRRGIARSYSFAPPCPLVPSALSSSRSLCAEGNWAADTLAALPPADCATSKERCEEHSHTISLRTFLPSRVPRADLSVPTARPVGGCRTAPCLVLEPRCAVAAAAPPLNNALCAVRGPCAQPSACAADGQVAAHHDAPCAVQGVPLGVAVGEGSQGRQAVDLRDHDGVFACNAAISVGEGGQSRGQALPPPALPQPRPLPQTPSPLFTLLLDHCLDRGAARAGGAACGDQEWAEEVSLLVEMRHGEVVRAHTGSSEGDDEVVNPGAARGSGYASRRRCDYGPYGAQGGCHVPARGRLRGLCSPSAAQGETSLQLWRRPWESLDSQQCKWLLGRGCAALPTLLPRLPSAALASAAGPCAAQGSRYASLRRRRDHLGEPCGAQGGRQVLVSDRLHGTCSPCAAPPLMVPIMALVVRRPLPSATARAQWDTSPQFGALCACSPQDRCADLCLFPSPSWATSQGCASSWLLQVRPRPSGSKALPTSPCAWRSVHAGNPPACRRRDHTGGALHCNVVAYSAALGETREGRPRVCSLSNEVTDATADIFSADFVSYEEPPRMVLAPRLSFLLTAPSSRPCGEQGP